MPYFFGLYVNSKVWSNTKLEFQDLLFQKVLVSNAKKWYWFRVLKKEIIRVYFFSPNVMRQRKFPVPKIYNEF